MAFSHRAPTSASQAAVPAPAQPYWQTMTLKSSTQRNRFRWYSVVLTIAHCIGPSPWVAAQPLATADLPDSAQIESKQEEIAKSDLTDDQKQAASEAANRALDQLERITSLRKQAVDFDVASKSASGRAEELKTKLQQAKERSPQTVDQSKSLAELEQQLTQKEQSLRALREDLKKADDILSSWSERREAIRNRLAAIEQDINGLPEASSLRARENEPPLLFETRRLESQAKRDALQAEAPALEAELAAIEAEANANLLRLQRDLIAEQLATADSERQSLKSVVEELQKEKGYQLLFRARADVDRRTDPLLKSLADVNLSHAQDYRALLAATTELEQQLEVARGERDYWSKQADEAAKQVERIGLTDAIGLQLRKQRFSLPNPRQYRARLEGRSPEISAAQLRLLTLQEERSADLAQSLRLGDTIDAPITEANRDEAEKLIETRNEEYLTPLIKAQGNYFDSLVELSNVESQIAQEAVEFADFIDEHILWVRSGPPLAKSMAVDRAEFWFIQREAWMQAGQTLIDDIGTHWVWYALALFVSLALLRNRLTFRRRICDLGDKAASGSCTQFRPTAETAVLTLIAAAPWPAVLGFLWWRLIAANSWLAAAESDRDFATFISALTKCVGILAVAYFPLEIFRLTFRPNGLADAHFGWSKKTVETTRRFLRSVMVLGLPILLVATFLGGGQDGYGREALEGRDTLQRLLFLAATVQLSVLLIRYLNPEKGAFSELIALHPESWLSRLKIVWYWPLACLPIVLALLSFFGYHFTACQLAWRLFVTSCFLLAILLATGLVSRLLLVQRRRLSMEQARQRRAAQQLATEDETLATTGDEIPSEEELRTQIGQSQSLVRATMIGLAFIAIWYAWVDVLPALGFLERWPLWQSTMQVTELITSETGEAIYQTRDVVDNVTVAELIFSGLLFLLTLIAAKNVPGLLEISLLQKLPIEASVRYAITTIVSYAIALLGLIFAFKTIGVHWSQVQWMATALTFGLAFGLQEMFANFVAGIIILFERPIRVGDIVTVDGVTGVVSRVRIRATTITNWDRKDYVVPNKDFITGRVLNWTLSDQVNRIVVNVGVAYGSDRHKTQELMEQIAREHPLIVDDPLPIVTFEEFGASSLNFVLRCYIAMKDMPSRLQVVHELHSAIDDAFREANIEIAFPQQDVHVRTVPESRETGVLPINGNPELKKSSDRS